MADDVPAGVVVVEQDASVTNVDGLAFYATQISSLQSKIATTLGGKHTSYVLYYQDKAARLKIQGGDVRLAVVPMLIEVGVPREVILVKLNVREKAVAYVQQAIAKGEALPLP